jgi:hypothetical protein
MDDLSFRLLQFMKEDFGDLGPFFLSKEMKDMGLNDLNNMTQEQKDSLVENLLRNVFSKSVSAQKLAIKKSYLESIIKETDGKKDEFTQKEKTRILMGIPKISTDSAFQTVKLEEKKEIIPREKEEETVKMEFMHPKKEDAKDVKEPISRGRKVFVLILCLIIVGFIIFSVFSKIAMDKTEKKTKGSTLPIGMQNSTANVTANGTINGSANASQNLSIQIPEIPIPNNGPVIIEENTSVPKQENQSMPTNESLPFMDNPATAYNATDLPNATMPNASQQNIPNTTETPQTSSNANTPEQPKEASCSIINQGSIFFDSSTKHFYGCDGIMWKQLDN